MKALSGLRRAGVWLLLLWTPGILSASVAPTDSSEPASGGERVSAAMVAEPEAEAKAESSAEAADEDGLLTAEQLLATGDQAGALAALEAWLADHPEDTAARFLEARLLGWSEDYTGALASFEQLLDTAPSNVDYLLGKSQVLVWMGNPEEALPLLERARTLAPDYEELWRLELNARIAAGDELPDADLLAFADAARARFPDADWARYEPPSRLRLDSGFIYDNLNNGFSSWKEFYLAGSYRLNPRLALFGQARATERFDQADQELRLGTDIALGENWTLTLEGTGAPDAQVLPSWSLAAQVDRRLPLGFGVQGGWRHAEYTASELDLFTVAGDYWFNRYRAGYTIYAASINNGPLIFSHRAQLDRYYQERSRVSLIASNGEEVESVGGGFFIVNEVQTLTVTGEHWLSDRWALTWEIGQAWTTLYDKQRFRAGFTRQF